MQSYMLLTVNAFFIAANLLLYRLLTPCVGSSFPKNSPESSSLLDFDLFLLELGGSSGRDSATSVV